MRRVNLIPKWPAAAEQVATQLAVLLDHERRLGFVVRVVGGEEIGEELAVFVDGIDRLTEEPGLATQPPHRFAIAPAVAADDVSIEVLHFRHGSSSWRRTHGKSKTGAR